MTDAATSEIAREADATRERITATFDELQQRLAPQALMHTAIDGALGKVSNTGASAAAAAKRLLKEHPVALAGSAAAVGLALVGRNKLAHAKVDLDGYEPYSDYDDGYGANMALADPVARLRRGGALLDRVAAQPLTAMAVGLAAGALIGALLGATERR